MSETREADLGQPLQRPCRRLIYRHSRITRLTHWINLLCVTVLLMSGLQIFMRIRPFIGGSSAPTLTGQRSRSGPMNRGMARRWASPGSVQQHSRRRESSAFRATQAATLYSAPFHGGLRFQAGAISLWGGGGISFLLGCSSRTSWLISWPELPADISGASPAQQAAAAATVPSQGRSRPPSAEISAWRGGAPL